VAHQYRLGPLRAALGDQVPGPAPRRSFDPAGAKAESIQLGGEHRRDGLHAGEVHRAAVLVDGALEQYQRIGQVLVYAVGQLAFGARERGGRGGGAGTPRGGRGRGRKQGGEGEKQSENRGENRGEYWNPKGAHVASIMPGDGGGPQAGRTPGPLATCMVPHGRVTVAHGAREPSRNRTERR
jgi:hypothetical protein